MSLSEESRADGRKTSNDNTIEGMDLLGLTFRSLDLTDAISREDEFLNTESKRLKRNKEESWTPEKEPSDALRRISLDEVSWHDTIDNCWLIIYDFVYDCTDFLSSHPGGLDLLLEYAGRDATLAFIGTGHTSAARRILDKYLIGELPPEERIFRVPGGVKVTGF